MTRPVELVSPFFPVPNERLCGARRSVLIKRGSRDRGVDDTFEDSREEIRIFREEERFFIHFA